MDFPNRKPNRLPDFDYSTPGAYFISICVKGKKCQLGHIVGGGAFDAPQMKLTTAGKVVEKYILSGNYIPGVYVDKYVIMPNHIHLIAVITEENMLREIRESPLRSRSIISKLIGYIKMNASKAIRQHYGEISVWQRGYYDHIIRNREDYTMLAAYIDTNPLRWTLDKLYTEE